MFYPQDSQYICHFQMYDLSSIDQTKDSLLQIQKEMVVIDEFDGHTAYIINYSFCMNGNMKASNQIALSLNIV